MGDFPHVLHGCLDIDHSSNLRSLNKSTNKQQQIELQLSQQILTRDIRQGNNNENQQLENEENKNKAKQIDTCTPESTLKRKNKPSKNKRDDAKRRESKTHENESEQEQEIEEEPCKKFIMVNENQGIDIFPLQVQYMTPPSAKPLDMTQEVCKINT